MRANVLTLILAAATLAACAKFEPTEELVIPLDDRPAVESAVTPPPISGGTLAVLRDDVTAVAADPDRDRVLVVSLLRNEPTHDIRLEAGDEPGRVVEGDDGIVHVVLRGSDALATIDTIGGAVLSRRATCGAPRGVAFDPVSRAVHVACASGSLVTFDHGATTPSRTIDVGVDARDVVLSGGRLFLTRFKTAELLEVLASGEVHRVATSAPSERDVFLPDGTLRVVRMSPGTAWRAVTAPDGSLVVVHQRGQDDEVVLSEPTPTQPSSYGGGGGFTGCASIVESAVTMFGPDGNVGSSPSLMGSVLPVDVAVSPSGMIAVANAGLHDEAMPQPFVRFHSPGGDSLDAPRAESSVPIRNSITLIDAESVRFGSPRSDCFFGRVPVTTPEPVTAVAFRQSAFQLVAQTREPARLYLINEHSGVIEATIELGGESRLDTGHELFHRDTGAGIACASCHGEGGEDGRVWHFSGLGPRRTQSLDVGLAGTAPFHWDGELRDLGHLMSEVFVGRMGGVHQSPARLATLEGYLFGLEPKTPVRLADDPAAVRGRGVFVSAGCETCHSGETFTNNRSFDVGTGGTFQVPSLVGIAYRAPFIHDGCADTLRDRFDASCGGPGHGTTALSAPDLDDLIAYLQTL